MAEDLKRWGFRFNQTTKILGNEEGGACARLFPIDDVNDTRELSERLALSDLGRRFGVKLDEPVDGYVVLMNGDETRLTQILTQAGMREYV